MPDPVKTDKPIEEQTLEELKATIDAGTVTATGQPIEQPPKEFEVKTATGQVYKGKTQDEVIQQLVRAQEHASMTIKEQRDLMAKLTQQQPPKPVQDNGGFDKAKYFKMLEDDPLSAQMYADSFREDYKFMRAAAAQFSELVEKSKFLQSVGEYYEDTPENANMLAERIQSRNLPVTAESLKATFVDLVSEGKIKLSQPQAEEVPPNRATPPPPLGGAGAKNAIEDLDAKIAAMSDKEYEAYLRKLGALQ